MLLDPMAFISIAVNVILLMVLIIVWMMAPRTAKFLIKKKLMLMQNKTLNLVAHDDRYMQIEAMDVSPEGLLEARGKHGLTKNFFLAKPQDDSANTEQNLVNDRRDLDILPPYSLEGVPVYFSHVSKAIATNPKVLTALRMANRVDASKPRVFNSKAVLQKPIEEENGDVTNTVPVTVMLSFDPVDIKKNFPSYWQQSNIDATKRRNQAIGVEKERRSGQNMIKMMIIGAIVAVAIIAGAVVALKLV